MVDPRGHANPIPADEEAERCVLGTLLTGSSAIEELAGEIDPKLFFFPTSQTILSAIIELHRRGAPIDIIEAFPRAAWTQAGDYRIGS